MKRRQKNVFFERLSRLDSDFFKKIKHFIKNLNETSVFAIWLAVLTLVSALIWGFTAGLRNNITADMVNKILAESGEERRIAQSVSMWHVPGNIAQFGTWFTMTSQENAVIFPFIVEGIFSPCLAIIGNDGKPKLIPLTVNAERVISRGNPGYLRVLTERIEKNAGILKRILDERYR
ncbi:MAG: hypothetical protein LBF80_01390 [Spirochaetaceae bacterium]|jgi:hypothetical protein|nr:hypothetical protein [Spirochaetaceae bacterium]